MASQVGAQVSTSSLSSYPSGQETLYKSRLSVAVCLSLGNKFLSRGQFNEANDAFNSAQHFLMAPPSISPSEFRMVADQNFSKQNHTSSNLSSSSPCTPISLNHIDTYDEDECDVGPRAFNSAIVPEDVVGLDVNFLQLVIAYNKAVAYQASKNYHFSSQLYKFITSTIGSYLPSGNVDAKLAHLAMRAHNNMGHIEYNQRKEELAGIEFERALAYAQLNFSHSQMEGAQQFEIANVLSNWCRTRWMMGQVDESVYEALEDVLRIRSTHLSADHPDVAAAHFNIGRAEFSRGANKKAMKHLLCYLRVSITDNDENNGMECEPTKALIYILQLQNERKDDEISQDLVWGVRTLQEKRRSLGKIHTDVATVLNYIGTLLFRRRELDYALCFFVQELCVEERLKAQSDSRSSFHQSEDVSISVTCNNIGRILQELERFREAKHYYQRSLGDENVFLASSTMNLYSTVWYNLGLIHDKMGAFNEAIRAFRVSLKLRRAMLGHKHSDVSCLFYNIGILQMEQNLLDEATESFREALAYRHVSGKGQLNDGHVIKTLQKLSAMHKAKGNLKGALAAHQDVISILATTKDFDQCVRNKKIAIAMRDIADLHQAQGNLQLALKFASGSVDLFRSLRSSSAVDEDAMEIDTSHDGERCSVEEEISAFLLVGSLQHELCEPMIAQNAFSETARILHSNLSTIVANSATETKTKATLLPLLEVSVMLSTPSCAPEA
eukprot:jgi/Psemu1/190507/e_gw1.101.116.1